MDILYLVDRLENLIANSRRMPLVNQIVIKESDIFNIIDQMRTAIPDEVKQARRVLQEKDRIFSQAQAEAVNIVARAREETERTMQREGLLKAAEERSKEIMRKANQQVEEMLQQAEEQTEQMKAEADSYAAETLHNLREHLLSIETDISRTVLSIERGLESLEGSDGGQGLEEISDENQLTVEDPQLPYPHRASPMAADTIGTEHSNFQ